MPPAKRQPPAGTTAPAASPPPSPPSSPSAAPPPRGSEPAFTLRMPFLSVSVTRPADGHAPAAAPSAPEAHAGHGPGRAPRLLFYGGVAALGVAGVVDWPVAAAIAAGTWVAAHARAGR